MRLQVPTYARKTQNRIPDDLYVGFVDSLLVENTSLALACMTTVAAGVVAGLASGQVSLWICALLLLIVSLVRLYFGIIHEHSRPSKNTQVARKREFIFVIGANVHMGLLSSWTLVVFAVTDDGFTRFLAASTTIPYAFGMWTRSFALDRGMNTQIAVAFFPLSAALFVAGGWYPTLIAISLVPLFFFIKLSSNRMKTIFRSEIIARNQNAMLAERLDTALNNMSHGLCMIDRDGMLVVANERFHRIFGLAATESLAGESLRNVFSSRVPPGLIDGTQFSRLFRALCRGSREAQDVTFPIDALDGRAIEITIHRTKDGGMVLVIQDVTERRNAQLEISRMAHYDAVTELPNRRSFEDELTKALRPERLLADRLTVMFLDLDDFKQVNDSLGHRTGDKLLGEIARRLRSVVDTRDLVARWGGDEFVILHHDSGDDAGTPATARRIIAEVSRPVVIDGSEVIVGASIGSATAPRDGVTPDALLSNADIALYAAKADGRRGWRAFESAMDTKIQVRRLIELELRAAVANDAIDVHFQPIYDVKSRRVVAFEALARWRHPARGPVSPAEFIPIVEEIGLMEEFGAVVLRRACAACASWPENVSVSVNLSPSQFRNGNIAQAIAGALDAANLSPRRLDIEITESTLLDTRGDARSTLDTLRARGLRISLDDFGTGYSSLSYLLSFPLDRIKIDRSFTIGLGIHERASILVESVAAMSRKLGMCVLIEGVETERQMSVIEALGTIAEVQGFLFSPPVPETAVAALLDRQLRKQAAA